MTTPNEAAQEVVATDDWNARVALIRKVPENFGTAQHAVIYSTIARKAYVPLLAPDSAYVHWLADYEVQPLQESYTKAHATTEGFTKVDEDSLRGVLGAEPTTLRIFRLLLGLTWPEFAATTAEVAEDFDTRAIGKDTIKAFEAGRQPTEAQARVLAAVIHHTMTGTLFPPARGTTRLKLQKPDTFEGWKTVREYAAHGVPLPVLLHQRHYGGAFRQLLDATSMQRGDVLEDAVEALVRGAGTPSVRTGSHNQMEIEQRFGLTVKPAPDFVFHDDADNLRAMLECKCANDGGTARDKAARFRSLRQESVRLGGVALFAVVAGLGWRRTADALGPVIRDTEGRTFTLPNLTQMLSVEPLSLLAGLVPTTETE
ncbi:MAG: hypothetical protein ACRDZ4_14225 [Egibacteraceae bacterium]